MNHNMKVLIVEDDNHVQSLLRFVFEEQHYEVLCASNETQAWEKFVQFQNEIDVVICEKDLKHGSGVELYRKLRSHNHKLKFIMTSAWCDNDTCKFKQDHNFFGLDKPFKVDVLQEFIDAPAQDSVINV